MKIDVLTAKDFYRRKKENKIINVLVSYYQKINKKVRHFKSVLSRDQNIIVSP